jgi:glycosyltransferase involved in cell wall biosynthesis
VLGGGIGSVLLNYYQHMNLDKFHFDFIVHGEEIGDTEDKLIQLGSKIYHIPSKRQSLVGNLRTIKEIIECGNYDAIHVHQGTHSFFPIYIAKQLGIKVRIAHSHSNFKPIGIKQKIVDTIFKSLLKRTATLWFGCGIEACENLWGKGSVSSNKAMVLHNAISTENYRFNERIREIKRSELGLGNDFVIGNVARFDSNKNHEFLVDIFAEIVKIHPNSKLLLVGNGELEKHILNKVSTMNLLSKVIFLGQRDDVHQLLQSMDCFVLPSKVEGLSVSLVEAQAAGLATIASIEIVPDEIKVTNMIHPMSLELSAKNWAETILEKCLKYERLDRTHEIQNYNFDIELESKKLEEFYKGVCTGSKNISKNFESGVV